MNHQRLISQLALLGVLFCGVPPVVVAQDAGKCTPPQSDTSVIDEHGTAHITRVLPVPDTLSPEAQGVLSKPMPDAEIPYDLEKDRAQASGWQKNGGELMRKTYPVNISEATIAAFRCGL